MAERGRCYIYRIYDRHETVYIGKGSGRRLEVQRRKFGLPVEKIEEGLSDDEAFERERFWIARFRPTSNRCPGGSGGRTSPPSMPRVLRGIVTEREWERSRKRAERELAEIERVGTRKYAARYLLTKLDEFNCEAWGVSKVDLNRIQEVANGPRC